MVEWIFSPSITRIILFYVIIFLFVTMCGFLFILIFQKFYINIKEKRNQYFKFKHNLKIRKYLLGVKEKIKKPRSKLEYEALAELCIGLLSSLEREDRKRLKEYIQQSGLVSYYKRRAGFSSLRKKLNSLKKLGYFQLKELKDYFLEYFYPDQKEEIRWEIIKALSFIADKEVLKKITEELSSGILPSGKYCEYVYTNIIQSFKSQKIIPEFLYFLGEIKGKNLVPLDLKKSILEACGTAGLKEASSLIKDYYFCYVEKAEMRITCMRVLGKLRSPELCGIVTTRLFDPDWRVRAVAARSAFMCNGRGVSHLRNLLYDEHYYVRINAAQTLASLGEDGLAVLRSEINSKDKFVQDTVKYMLRR